MSRLAMNLFFLCATAVAVIAGGPLPLAVAETITIQGSTTFVRSFEPYEHLIETISKHQVEFIPNKSMPGLLALLEGRARHGYDFGFTKKRDRGTKKYFGELAHMTNYRCMKS